MHTYIVCFAFTFVAGCTFGEDISEPDASSLEEENGDRLAYDHPEQPGLPQEPVFPSPESCGPGTGRGPCTQDDVEYGSNGITCGSHNCGNGSGCGPCDDYACGPGSSNGPCQ